MNNEKIVIALNKKLSDYNTSELEKEVINTLIDNENIEQYIKEVLQHGCSSGIVSELIYYKDTSEFFKKHFEDIFTLVDDYKENTGEELSVTSFPRYNFYAWFAYENVCDNLANELGIEV